MYIHHSAPSHHTNIQCHMQCHTTHATPYHTSSTYHTIHILYQHHPRDSPIRAQEKRMPRAEREHSRTNEYRYHPAVPTPQLCMQGAGGVEKSITNKGDVEIETHRCVTRVWTSYSNKSNAVEPRDYEDTRRACPASV